MKATRQLHDLWLSLWLDKITRGILNDGTLQRYIGELSVTGLTCNPTTFDYAITKGYSYDDAIRRKAGEAKSGETLFFELAIEDLLCAADLFRLVHDHTGSVDAWVSLEVLRSWSTIPSVPYGRRPNCTAEPNARICSSSPAHRRDDGAASVGRVPGRVHCSVRSAEFAREGMATRDQARSRRRRLARSGRARRV